MNFKKVISVLLVMVLTVSMVVSCSSAMPSDEASTATDAIEINSPEKVTEEEAKHAKVDELGQFYSLNSSDISVIYGEVNSGNDLYSQKIIYENRVLSISYGLPVESDNYIANNDNYYLNNELSLVMYDIQEKTFEFFHLPEISDDIYEAYLFIVDGHLLLVATTSHVGNVFFEIIVDDMGTYRTVDYTSIGNVLPGTSTPISENNILGSENFTIYSIYSFENYVMVTGYYVDNIVLLVRGENGKTDLLTFSDYFPDDIISYDPNHYILNVSGTYKMLDTTDMSISDTEGYDLSYVQNNNVFSSFDANGFYVNSYEGLYYVKPATKYYEKLVDYNCVIGDASLLRDSIVISNNDDEFVFCGVSYETQGNTTCTTMATIKPIENPYEDRQVIKMACAYLDEGIVKNIKSFNDSNDECFIVYRLLDGTIPDSQIPSGNFDSYYSVGGDASSFYNSMQYHSDVEAMQYSMIQDGQYDLLYGFGDNALFDTSRVCLNLNEYSEEIDNGNLFNNVLKAKETEEGKLYWLPLDFAVNSLCTGTNVNSDSDSLSLYIDMSENSIDIDEYFDAVATMNYDPFHAGVSNYECLDRMISNEFTHYINTDTQMCGFNNDYFLKIFEYSMSYDNNQSEIIYDLYGTEVFGSSYDNSASSDYSLLEFVQINSIYDFLPLWYMDLDSFSYYGVPNTDGKNLTAIAVNTLGIYCDTDETEYCLDFIKYMLSDDVEISYEYRGFCINKNVNQRKTDGMLQYLDSIGIDYIDDNKNEAMTAFIKNIDEFEAEDNIISFAVLKSINDYYSNGENTDNTEAIEKIETSVQDVLDRY